MKPIQGSGLLLTLPLVNKKTKITFAKPRVLRRTTNLIQVGVTFTYLLFSVNEFVFSIKIRNMPNNVIMFCPQKISIDVAAGYNFFIRFTIFLDFAQKKNMIKEKNPFAKIL
jgi:hypothetical protein